MPNDRNLALKWKSACKVERKRVKQLQAKVSELNSFLKRMHENFDRVAAAHSRATDAWILWMDKYEALLQQTRK